MLVVHGASSFNSRKRPFAVCCVLPYLERSNEVGGKSGCSSMNLPTLESLSPARDWIALLGFAAATYGVYQIYPPMAWIWGGAFLIYVGVLLGHAEPQEDEIKKSKAQTLVEEIRRMRSVGTAKP